MHGSQGGPGPKPGKKFGRFFVFFSPQLILQFKEGVQWLTWFYYRENYTFLRIQWGSTIFQGGSNFLGGGPTSPGWGGGGPNAKFYINSYNLLHNCRYPPPPLDPHMNLVNETLQTLFNLACSDMPGSSSIVLFDSLCPSQ